MIKMTIQDTEETAEFKVLEKPIIQKPLIAESDVVTIDNNLSTYVTGTQKRELTVGLGYLDSVGYETLRRIRDRQYAVLKYPTVTITADEPVDLGYGEDVPDYRQRLVQLKGKNLFDKDSAPQKHFYINGNTLDDYGGNQNVSTYIPIAANSTYTITKPILSNNRFAVGTCSAVPAIGVSLTNSLQQNDVSSLTITSGSTDKYLVVYFKQGSDATPNSTIFSQIQIELGSVATTYEPYINIELCKIGDYQDYIYKSGDKWYVHRDTGKYVYNNDLSDNGIGSTYVAMLTPTLPTLPNIAFTAGLFWCNSYTPVMQNNTGLQGTNASARIRVNTSLDIADSYAAVRALAATNNLTIHYPLATPTDTEITNETLKAQLDALQNSAFDRWTKVETNVQDPSLQPYLTVTQGEITGSGKEVMLEGTTEDLLDFVILGDTTQQTYSGKNLFNKDGTFQQGFVGSSGEVAYSAESVTLTDYIPVEAETTYRVSYDAIVAGTEWRGIGYYDSSKTFISRSSNQGVLFFTPPTGAAYIRVYFYNANGMTVAQLPSYIKNIQIEKGSIATSYEPYVGGAPAPNPDYPQEVRSVNGDITFDFSGPSGVKKYIMVGKMTLAEQRIIDNCGTNEQVQVSFRESKQI